MSAPMPARRRPQRRLSHFRSNLASTARWAVGQLQAVRGGVGLAGAISAAAFHGPGQAATRSGADARTSSLLPESSRSLGMTSGTSSTCVDRPPAWARPADSGQSTGTCRCRPSATPRPSVADRCRAVAAFRQSGRHGLAAGRQLQPVESGQAARDLDQQMIDRLISDRIRPASLPPGRPARPGRAGWPLDADPPGMAARLGGEDGLARLVAIEERLLLTRREAPAAPPLAGGPGPPSPCCRESSSTLSAGSTAINADSGALACGCGSVTASDVAPGGIGWWARNRTSNCPEEGCCKGIE